ncbi:uncharacterized protein [Argopecten irradians]|uniref:uncharacterized protein n=1 Tax=Argopecten irradians TaxID=31199 RepID=UPI0037127F09
MAEKRGHDDKESTPPRKKVRLHSQKYMSEYEQSFPCFRKSAMGVNHAYCTVCNVNISISHGGIGDLKKHIGTKKHVEVAKLREGQKISNFFPSKSTSSDDGVIRAEVIFTKFIIENNAPLTLADNAGTMFRNMFPDSEIAKKYSCARTKSTAIAHCLAEDDDHQITKVISTAPFSIATDGSNDYGDVKLYPIIVKYFDDTVGLISTTMLTLSECEGRSTGENIFS